MPQPTTTALDDRSVAAPPTPSDGDHRRLGDLSPTMAGAGACTFAAVVVVQNVLRGAFAPANDAPVADVVTSYASHRALEVLLSVTFVVSGIGLAVFLGGVGRLLLAGPRRGWAISGLVGAGGIIALFGTTLAADSALTNVASGAHPEPAAVSALWALHNGVFTVLLLMIGIALVGLGRAGTSTGITPSPFEWLAPVGGGLLAVGAAGGPLVAAGEAMPLFGLAGIGFVVWLAFLATTGVRLLRMPGR